MHHPFVIVKWIDAGASLAQLELRACFNPSSPSTRACLSHAGLGRELNRDWHRDPPSCQVRKRAHVQVETMSPSCIALLKTTLPHPNIDSCLQSTSLIHTIRLVPPSPSAVSRMTDSEFITSVSSCMSTPRPPSGCATFLKDHLGLSIEPSLPQHAATSCPCMASCSIAPPCLVRVLGEPKIFRTSSNPFPW
ncbi:hypothetical protein Salat_1709200 [Sesamum alatum]|uniref:Uncharacterized protein n=1 Tax=Sesamum alatum TaxID=300844 RepID=A0AAE1Y7K0_9LAMI|nr:hypothetical protein Salat_1709200 [Sesamum alatum]